MVGYTGGFGLMFPTGYPIWWPGGPFFCHRSPPPEFRRAPLKNQRLGRPPLLV
jgi:hypothetical protein